MKSALRVSLCLAVAGVTLIGTKTFAQGCVAAHSNQRVIEGLMSMDSGGTVSSKWEHNLTVDIGYRVFNSNKYYQGSNEIPRPTAIRNHQNIFDIGIEYVVSPKWSLIADVPGRSEEHTSELPVTDVSRMP